MRTASLWVAFTLAAFAQPAPEIRGVVLEPGGNQPVVGAEVALRYIGAEQPRMMGGPQPQPIATTTTDAAGAFAFALDKVGYYSVAAKKDGFNSPGEEPGMPSSARFMITADAPRADARLFLSRAGTITGRIVDEETRKPVAGLRVVASRRVNFGGRYIYMGGSATTDADGHFHVGNLLTGDYVLEIAPQKQGKERVLARFTEDDAKIVDQDVEHTFWPGGHGQEMASPMNLGSGATLDFGQIAIRKVPYYRVRLHVTQWSCGEGETATVYEYFVGWQGDNYTRDLAPVPCGSDVLVTGFARGNYNLIVSADKGTRETRGTAVVPVNVLDRNLTVTGAVVPGAEVQGSFVTEEGAQQPDFSKLSIWLDPIGGLRRSETVTPAKADAKGQFRLTGITAVNQRPMISGAGPAHYVKEIRYNGQVVRDGIIPMAQPAMSHSVTIVLDDKPATLTGVVKDGDNPARAPWVVLARWPLTPGQVFIPAQAVAGDDSGRYQLTGLAPGEYRLVAVRAREQYDTRPPKVLEQALAAAKKIEITPGGLQTINVDVVSW